MVKRSEEIVSNTIRKRFTYITSMCDYFIEMYKESPTKLKKRDLEAYNIIKSERLYLGTRFNIHKLHISMALKY